MSTPLNSQTKQKRPIGKTTGLAVLGVIVALLCLRGIGSLIDSATGLDNPVATSAGTPTLAVERPADAPHQLSDEQLKSPNGVIVNYLLVTPSYWNNFGGGGWGDPVDTVTLDADDVIIDLNQPFSTASAYQAQADEIRAWVVGELRQHKDNATVAGVDLVAVRSADGVLIGYEKL